jgi:phage shock protein PspC (stress-responsive transcriptional regulator)
MTSLMIIWVVILVANKWVGFVIYILIIAFRFPPKRDPEVTPYY